MSEVILKQLEPKIRLEELDNTNLTTLQKTILANRVDMEMVDKFGYKINDLFNSDFNPVKNIDLLPDLKHGGELIATYIEDGKHILLASDMDCDGINSASVLHVSFRDILKVKPENFKSIVNRRLAGNGFNNEFVNRIKKIHDEWHIDMVITADHGSSDEKAYAELKAYGVDCIVVTDHHTIPVNNYPKSADLVINPHRLDSNYYKDVSGCFVAYLTMISTMKGLRGDYYLEEFESVIPYVAVSTISDVMSLSLPINRQVVKYGLRIINSFQHPLWLAIKNVLGIKNRINSTDIGFKIAPLLNTANRVNEEDLGFNLLISENLEDATKYATMLNRLNTRRKKVQKELLIQAEHQQSELPQENSIVVSLSSEYAINGIVAGNLGERHGKPTVCFLSGDDEKTLTGSGRGILPGINLVKIYNDINKSHPGILIKFGGHKMAAGCKIYADKIEEFRKLFEEETVKQLGVVKKDNVIYYDKVIKSTDITPIMFKDLNRVLPYGSKWDKPVFVSKLTLGSILTLGSVLAKIKFIASDNTEIEATHFFRNKNSIYTIANIKDLLKYGDKVTLVYSLNLNSFNDVVTFEMEVIEIIKENK